MNLDKRKIGYILLGTLALIAVIVAIIVLLGRKEPVPQASPTPTPGQKARGASNDKFGPRPRIQNTSNIDIGVRTVGLSTASPTPSNRRSSLDIRLASADLAQAPVYQAPSGSPAPALTATPVPTPPPLLTPPQFTPLAPAPAPQGKEVVVIYAKGDSGKRQIYARSLERDRDDQLVTSVFDDFGVSFASATQKLAFYSNEEGPSDSTRPRSKLKVLDLANGRVTTIATGLPGNWPAAWSGDGKKLAIPTANSIFIADVFSGSSLQVPTASNPGAIVWAPGNLKFYYQAETSRDNHDIFEADSITAQARPVVIGQEDDTYPTVSADVQRLSFMRKGGDTEGNQLIVRDVAGGNEKKYPETAPMSSYLWNLDLTQLLFVKSTEHPRLSKIKGSQVTDVGDLSNPTLVGWDRDYGHAFVLADDEDGKTLYSVDIESGQAEKIKTDVAEAVPGAGGR